jgi:hypothetical protein
MILLLYCCGSFHEITTTKEKEEITEITIKRNPQKIITRRRENVLLLVVQPTSFPFKSVSLWYIL